MSEVLCHICSKAASGNHTCIQCDKVVHGLYCAKPVEGEEFKKLCNECDGRKSQYSIEQERLAQVQKEALIEGSGSKRKTRGSKVSTGLLDLLASEEEKADDIQDLAIPPPSSSFPVILEKSPEPSAPPPPAPASLIPLTSVLGRNPTKIALQSAVEDFLKSKKSRLWWLFDYNLEMDTLVGKCKACSTEFRKLDGQGGNISTHFDTCLSRLNLGKELRDMITTKDKDVAAQTLEYLLGEISKRRNPKGEEDNKTTLRQSSISFLKKEKDKDITPTDENSILAWVLYAAVSAIPFYCFNLAFCEALKYCGAIYTKFDRKKIAKYVPAVRQTLQSIVNETLAKTMDVVACVSDGWTSSSRDKYQGLSFIGIPQDFSRMVLFGSDLLILKEKAVAGFVGDLLGERITATIPSDCIVTGLTVDGADRAKARATMSCI